MSDIRIVFADEVWRWKPITPEDAQALAQALKTSFPPRVEVALDRSLADDATALKVVNRVVR